MVLSNRDRLPVSHHYGVALITINTLIKGAVNNGKEKCIHKSSLGL